jgi:sugar phosphate isomerase/epimerase
MRVAVMDDVLRPADDPFVAAARLGFAGLEVSLARDDLRSPGRERLAELRGSKEASGLEIPSLVLGEHSQGGIADADPAVAEAAAEDVREALDWAAELGATAILVPFFARGELVSDDDLERCATAFRALCRLANQRGVALCYEGTLPAERVRLLAERVDSLGFGCYFDLANAVGRGLDPPTELRTLGRLVQRVHVKDALARPGDCPPGLGRVDFAESERALREIGYDGWLVLETPPGPAPVVARDLSFARSAFPGLERAPGWPVFGAFSYDFGAGRWEHLGETFRRLGLRAVQLGGELLAECLDDPDSIEPKLARLREYGVEVAALAGYRNLVAPDPAVREANLDALERCLELAPRLGTTVVATETGTRHPEGDWTDSADNWGETAWSLLHDALERLLPVAERTGTVLALEASVTNVLRTQSQLVGLLERFPSPHLQVVCDPYNYLSRSLLAAQGRHTRELLDRFEHRFVLAHLKDVDPGGAEKETVELGTGVFVQLPYLEFLRDRRADLPLIVEHLPLDHVPRALDRVRSLVSSGSRPA